MLLRDIHLNSNRIECQTFLAQFCISIEVNELNFIWIKILLEVFKIV